MRVLQIFGALNCGGAETMLMNLYRKIDKQKIQFDFVKHTKEECFYDKEIISLGAEIYSCPKYNVLNHFSYIKWWKNFFKNHPEYTIIHSHVRSTASIIFKIAKSHGRTTIAHSHSTSNGGGIKAVIKKFFQKKIVKWADHYFACSKDSGEWLYGLDVVKSEKFKILPNAVDIEKFFYNETIRNKLRSEFKIQNDFVVGHIGRFTEVKNHNFLIDIFEKLHQVKPNSKLILVGTGELRNEIEYKVKTLNLIDNVLFLGVRSDVYDLVNIFDCFIFPSKWEGLPVTLVEVQANGLPVVMSDIITDEIALTSLSVKVPLSVDIEIWVNKILNTERNQSEVHKIADAGFDINKTVLWLQDFYLSI